MTVRDIVLRSGRTLGSAKLRTLLTASALAVGGFTLTLTLAASQGTRDYSHRLVSSNFDPTSLVVAKDKALFNGGTDTKPQEYDSSLAGFGGGGGQGRFLVKQLSQQDIRKLRALPGVADVKVQYQFNAQYITRDGMKQYTGSLADYATAPKPDVVAGRLPAQMGAGDVLLPNDYVSLLGFGSAQKAIGQTVRVQVQQLTGEAQEVSLRVVGVITPPSTNVNFGSAHILLATADAARLNNFIYSGTTSANHYLNATVKVKNGEQKATLEATKQRIEKAGYAAETAAEAQQFLNQIINVLQIVVLVFGAITLVASFFGVVNTQYISVLERTAEVGLMKALGMRRGNVSWLFIIEATWIGLLGGVLGSGLAIGVGALLNPWLSHKLNFGSEHLLVFKPLQIVALIVFLMLITTGAGLLPARKAARLDPIEALRTE